MTLSQIAFTLKVLISLIPFVADLVRKDKIREAGQKDVLIALHKVLDQKFKEAQDAQPVDEDKDPYNRRNSGSVG